MKGKKIFTKQEAQTIMNLINEKVKAPRDKQRVIRTKIRKIGFFASDFGLSGGYTSSDFKTYVHIKGDSDINTSKLKNPVLNSREKANSIKKDSDENYVLDLCDKVLKQKSNRQFHFEFLLGDSGTRLPVDAYYEPLDLVIEYRERQHTEVVKFFDKRKTVSGVGRGEQRKIYDQRRRDVLPKHGIKLIEISYSDFNHDSRKRIIRDKVKDKEIIKNILK